MKKIALFLPLISLVGCSATGAINDFQKCNYVTVGSTNYQKQEPVYYKIAKYKLSVEYSGSNYIYGENKDIVYYYYPNNDFTFPEKINVTGNTSTTATLEEVIGSCKDYKEVFYSVGTRTVKQTTVRHESINISNNWNSELKDKTVFQILGNVEQGISSYTINLTSYYYYTMIYHYSSETIFIDVGSGTAVTYQLYTEPDK